MLKMGGDHVCQITPVFVKNYNFEYIIHCHKTNAMWTFALKVTDGSISASKATLENYACCRC